MRIGDLVKVDEKVMYKAGYGIVIALEWRGDKDVISVILIGESIPFPFYEHELEVVSEGG